MLLHEFGVTVANQDGKKLILVKMENVVRQLEELSASESDPPAAAAADEDRSRGKKIGPSSSSSRGVVTSVASASTDRY